MYIYTPLCRYWIALYRYVLVFIVPHVDIELEDNKQFISNIPRMLYKALALQCDLTLYYGVQMKILWWRALVSTLYNVCVLLLSAYVVEKP